MKSTDMKFKTVIDKNTFFFFNKPFEEKYEGHMYSMQQILLNLKNEIDASKLEPKHFEELIVKENGLRALLALTAVSNETLKRLTTIIRVTDDKELCELVHKNEWSENEDMDNLKEWTDEKIEKLIKENEFFRRGIIAIFFKGATIPFLVKTLPLFELKKLSISKLQFEIPDMIDTLARYKEKGSYSGKKENNPEILIEQMLSELNITFERGDLGELVQNAPDSKRTMDFIIPSKKNPLIIIESSYLATTSSGQGDKSKTEISVGSLIKQHYRKSVFVGFVDGIGWYVRKGDLKRMVNAYDDVFTFHEDEMNRFKDLLIETFPI